VRRPCLCRRHSRAHHPATPPPSRSRRRGAQGRMPGVRRRGGPAHPRVLGMAAVWGAPLPRSPCVSLHPADVCVFGLLVFGLLSSISPGHDDAALFRSTKQAKPFAPSRTRSTASQASRPSRARIWPETYLSRTRWGPSSSRSPFRPRTPYPSSSATSSRRSAPWPTWRSLSGSSRLPLPCSPPRFGATTTQRRALTFSLRELR
jgi:hypothetical protein